MLCTQDVAQQSIVSRLRVLFEQKAAKEREIDHLDARRQSLRTERSIRGEGQDYDRHLTTISEKVVQIMEEFKAVSEQIEKLETEYRQLDDEKECK
jgi:cell division protein FtsB